MQFPAVARALFLALLVTTPCSATAIAAEPQKGESPPQDVVVAPGTPKAWTLLTCSVLFERNGERHDLLNGLPSNPERIKEVQQLLKDSWDIESRPDLLAMLEWLELEGHRTGFDERGKRLSKLSKKELDQELARCEGEDELRRCEFAASHWTQLGKTGLLAWDFSRHIALCRWGYACGYITEAEAWDRIFPIAQKIQAAYRSWEDLNEGYCLGREYWKGEADEATRKAFEKLKTSDDSPWKTTSWKLKLDPKAKAPKKKS